MERAGPTSGGQLDLFTNKTLFGKSKHNEIIKCLNALLNIQIKRGGGGEDSVVYGDNGVIIQLPDSGGGSGGGDMVYLAEYGPSNNYVVHDVVRVSPSSSYSTTNDGGISDPGVYVCIQSGPGLSNYPKSPLQGETAFWHMLAPWAKGFPNYRGAYSSGTAYSPYDLVYTGAGNTRIPWICEISNGPGHSVGVKTPTFPEPGTVYWRCLANFQQDYTYRFKSLNTNYIVCRTWDGASEGADDVNIALPWGLREVASRSVDGTSVTYDTYTHSAQTRMAYILTASEKEVINPRYVLNDVIYAWQPSYIGVGGCTLMDRNNDGRVWAKRYDQA